MPTFTWKSIIHTYLLGTSNYLLQTSDIEGLNVHTAEIQHQPNNEHNSILIDDLQSGGRSFCTETVGPIACSNVFKLSGLNWLHEHIKQLLPSAQ